MSRRTEAVEVGSASVDRGGRAVRNGDRNGRATDAGALVASDGPRLTVSEFTAISELTYRVSGIKLDERKQGLVQSRLSKRLRQLGLADFGAYLEYVERDGSGQALVEMIDALTTNKTSFFREIRHFEFLSEHVIRPAVAGRRPLRLWSAGCSSGEEPYSLAMRILDEARGGLPDVRILATDLSTRVLARARTGVYDLRRTDGIDAAGLRRWFVRVPGMTDEKWQVRPEVRSMVSFARLNLMDSWPMKGPFDAILCRNVMIYFDKETQERLVGRFASLLAPGGYLFVGHSESLSGIQHGFRYIQPAVYSL